MTTEQPTPPQQAGGGSSNSNNNRGGASAPPPALWILATINAADAAETLSVSSALIAFRFEDGSSLTNTQSALLSAAVYLGMLVGGLVGGRLGDANSKRKLLVGCLAVDCICGLTAFLARYVFASLHVVLAVLCVCRVGAGLGVGASIPLIFAIVGESHNADRKARDVNVLALGWSAGSVFCAFVAWIVLRGGDYENWNIVILFGSAPALFAMTALSMESFIMRNRKGVNFVHDGMTHVSPRILRTRSSGGGSSSNSSSSLPSLFITPPLPVVAAFVPSKSPLLFSLMLAWFGLSFATYGVSTWITSLYDTIITDPFFAALLFACAQLPGNVFSSFLPQYFPNRRTIVIIATGLSVSALILATITQSSASIVFVIASCFFASSSSVSWTTLDLASTEAFPSSTALGIATASGRVGSIVANSLNPFLVEHNLVLFVAAMAVSVSGWSVLRFTATTSSGADGESSRRFGDESTSGRYSEVSSTSPDDLNGRSGNAVGRRGSIVHEEERDNVIVVDVTIA